MTSITNKSKLRLGTKTDTGYEFRSKIDFTEDFSVQIERVMEEKKAYDELKPRLEELKKEIEKRNAIKKNKNITYYFEIGKKLLFLDGKNFENIAPGSIYTKVAENFPNILPHIKERNTVKKHLEIMFQLAHMNKNLLKRASWDQWYEILKFKEIYINKKLLKDILKECKKGVSGKSLRSKIKELRRKLKE